MGSPIHPRTPPPYRMECGQALNSRPGKTTLPARRHATSALETCSEINLTTNPSRDRRSATSNGPPRHLDNIREEGREENKCVAGLYFGECAGQKTCLHVNQSQQTEKPIVGDGVRRL